MTASNPDHTSLRLWLRLLACAKLIENRVRGQLRDAFETTLPRFDLLAQLYRNPQGLKMSELSQLLMVTGGNITGLTDQLEKDGLVERVTLPEDRRANIIHLTDAGRAFFEAMAALHETWIIELLAGLEHDEQQAMMRLLSKLKDSLQEKVPAK